MLSGMESSPQRPSAAEAAAALAAADALRDRVARGVAMPSWFAASLGLAITLHIATTAVGVAEGRPWVLAAGLAVFAAVAGVQLARFRRRNGLWLGGLATRVVLGAGAAASASYAVALAAAIWAAYAAQGWLVALSSLAGGAAYALSGHRWMRSYRAQPALHARGDSPAWPALLAAAAVAGVALAVLGR
jgi:hypothetical protein